MEKVFYKIDDKGNRFPYINIGREDHGRPSFRLWVSHSLVQTDPENGEFITFPVAGKVIKTEKGNFVLKPEKSYVTHDIYVECGYRGDSDFEILEPKDAQVYAYEVYSSPRGSLVFSRGALVTVKNTVLKYRWKRTGRLYGEPSEGITIISPDGKKEDFEYVPDGLEALQELEKELE
jgi:hypothetical protein